MRDMIDEYWSSPQGIYTLKDSNISQARKVEGNLDTYRVIVFSSPNAWYANQKNIEKSNFKGLIIVIGELIPLSKILREIKISSVERIIACRIDSKTHLSHRLLLVLNYSEEARPYREIRERYTYCPICGKSSKDYGGKKHHYPSDGTWIRDVWNKFSFKTPIIDDKLFIEAIYNLYCLQPSQRILLVKDSGDLHMGEYLCTAPAIHTLSEYYPPEMYEEFGQIIINGDCMEVLPWLASKSVTFDLIFVDPPYNLGKKYEQYNDKQNIKNYSSWCIEWAKLAYPLLAPNGYFVILNTPLNIMLQLPQLLKHYYVIGDIVWDDLAVPVARKMQPTYYSLIFLSKKEGKISNSWYQIREPVYCKRSSCINSPSSYSNGASIWSDIHRTRQKSRRWGHPCNLPEEIVERIIGITKMPIDKDTLQVLDFLVGVGTTTMASYRKKCHSTCVELSPIYYQTVKYRLKNKLFKNPNNDSRRNNNKKKTKRNIQKMVAIGLERATRVGKGYTTSEQIEWLIEKKIIAPDDLKSFIRPGEILKGVGKGGAPGENNGFQMNLSSFDSQ